MMDEITVIKKPIKTYKAYVIDTYDILKACNMIDKIDVACHFYNDYELNFVKGCFENKHTNEVIKPPFVIIKQNDYVSVYTKEEFDKKFCVVNDSCKTNFKLKGV